MVFYAKCRKYKITVDKPLFLLYDKENVFWKTFSNTARAEGGDEVVSIRDVAKQAGVAISTVSKVLNHYPNVSEDAKAKVNAAIEELGFVPNSIASALSSKKTDRVALLLDVNRHVQTVDEIPMQYIVGAINRAKELEMDVITVFFTMIQEMSVEEMTRYFLSQSIEGLIICGLSKQDTALHKLIRTGKFKIVLIDAPGVAENTSCIHIDPVSYTHLRAHET